MVRTTQSVPREGQSCSLEEPPLWEETQEPGTMVVSWECNETGVFLFPFVPLCNLFLLSLFENEELTKARSWQLKSEQVVLEVAHTLCLWVLKGLSVGSCGKCSFLLENSCIDFFPLCKHTGNSAPRPLFISALCLDSLLRPSPPQRGFLSPPLAPWPGAPTVFLTTHCHISHLFILVH